MEKLHTLDSYIIFLALTVELPYIRSVLQWILVNMKMLLILGLLQLLAVPAFMVSLSFLLLNILIILYNLQVLYMSVLKYEWNTKYLSESIDVVCVSQSEFTEDAIQSVGGGLWPNVPASISVSPACS